MPLRASYSFPSLSVHVCFIYFLVHLAFERRFSNKYHQLLFFSFANELGGVPHIFDFSLKNIDFVLSLVIFYSVIEFISDLIID